MGRLRKKIIGKRVFGSKVEVTDPFNYLYLYLMKLNQLKFV